MMTSSVIKTTVNSAGMFIFGTVLYNEVMISVCFLLFRYLFWWLVPRWCCWCVSFVCCSTKFMNLSVNVIIIVGMYTGICGWKGLIYHW